MKQFAITVATIASLTANTASANDLVKILAALQGRSYGRYDAGPRYDFQTRYNTGSHYGVTSRHSQYDRFDTRGSFRGSFRDANSGYVSPGEAARLRALERAEEQARQRRLAELQRIERLRIAELERQERLRNQRIRTHVGYHPQTPPPVLPPRARRAVPHHAFGDIVDCHVPLYPRLRIRDRHNIAPGARRMVVAVKAPNACAHACDCCNDRVVYVPVYAPLCEPRHVRVSPCGRTIRLDYGKYEIDIISTPQYVKVDYDN